VTLCLVAAAIFAGFHLWQYYMLTPWTRDGADPRRRGGDRAGCLGLGA